MSNWPIIFNRFISCKTLQQAPQDIYMRLCCLPYLLLLLLILHVMCLYSLILIDFRWIELHKSSLEFPVGGQPKWFFKKNLNCNNNAIIVFLFTISTYCWNSSFKQRNGAHAIKCLEKTVCYNLIYLIWCRANIHQIACTTTMKYFHLFCAGSRAIRYINGWLHNTRVCVFGAHVSPQSNWIHTALEFCYYYEIPLRRKFICVVFFRRLLIYTCVCDWYWINYTEATILDHKISALGAIKIKLIWLIDVRFKSYVNGLSSRLHSYRTRQRTHSM